MDPLGMGLAVGAVAVAAVLAYLLGRGRERARQLREKEAAKDEASLIRNGHATIPTTCAGRPS